MKDGLYMLYALQKLDLEIKRIDAAVAALTASTDAKKKYAVAKMRSESAKRELAALEDELAVCEQEQLRLSDKYSSSQKRLYDGSISNTKELESIQREIAYTKECAEKNDERILELYSLIDEGKTKVAKYAELFEKVTKQAKLVIAKENEAKAKYAAARELAVARYNEFEPRIEDKQLLSKYKSISKRTAAGGIAKVVDKKCEGCKTVVGSLMIGSIIEGDEVVFCESCGRILLVDK